MPIRPFTLDIPAATLSDLRARLQSTRLPGTLPGQGQSEGIDMDVLKSLLVYWQHGFD